MKFFIEGPIKDNIYNMTKKIGYRFKGKGEKTNEMNFTKPSSGYPRFHLFLRKDGEDLVLNLHLDQKKPSYKGTPAHAGEYDGKIVSNEAKRIKKEFLSHE